MTASGRTPARAARRPAAMSKITASEKGDSAAVPEIAEATAPGTLGSRLRARREETGLSLRQFARDLNVSASFISQLETGKTQPSVATLYAICSALNMTIDDVFDDDEGREEETPTKTTPSVRSARNRTLTHSPVVSPAKRRRIKLDSGVTWERLSSATNANFDFVFVRYDVGGSSNNDGRLIRHIGTECGYVVSGVLEVTLGFETFIMEAGDAISFDSSTPHRLANVGTVPVEAIWFDEGGHNRQS
jgi:transcriptional regulator with XRE-family HTH domain